MKVNLLYLGFLLLVASCQQVTNNPQEYSNNFEDKNTTPIVSLLLSDFTNYEQLVQQVQKIVCQDHVPKLSFKEKASIKNIYPVNLCEPIKFDPKPSDLIFITNGKLFKNQKEIAIDSLNYIVKKDFTNYGQDAQFASSPEKLLIIIEFEKETPVDQLQSILSKVTAAYDQANTKQDLKIVLHLDQAPPPPPADKN